MLARFFQEELEGVLLVSQRDRWPSDLPAVEFARNDLDLARSGDAFLIPRPGVLMADDPARGSGHGSHYEYDTHVPLVFWGGAFRARPAPKRNRRPTIWLRRLRACWVSPSPDAVGRDLFALP